MKIEKITPQIATFYLGQECDVEWLTSGSLYVCGDRWNNIELTLPMLGRLKDGVLEVTPHLRRLESITEEEAIHIHNDVIGFEYSGIIPCRDWICLGFDGNSSFYQDARGYPTVWLYLLSRGFDLFGLIDAGLAKEI